MENPPVNFRLIWSGPPQGHDFPSARRTSQREKCKVIENLKAKDPETEVPSERTLSASSALRRASRDRSGACLPAEGFERLRILSYVLGQKLQSDKAAKLGVLSFISFIEHERVFATFMRQEASIW
jgi:hypothetical protein